MVMYTLEQRWEVSLRSTYRRCLFWQKKIIFSDEAHFDHGGYVNTQNCRISSTENAHTYIEKLTHLKRVTVWCGFWSRRIIGPFFFENEQAEAVTVNDGPFWTNFCSQKLKRRILATFGFNSTALRATQPKLHSMSCALFFGRSRYKPQSWCRLATSELRFDTVGVLFVGYRQR